MGAFGSAHHGSYALPLPVADDAPDGDPLASAHRVALSCPDAGALRRANGGALRRPVARADARTVLGTEP